MKRFQRMTIIFLTLFFSCSFLSVAGDVTNSENGPPSAKKINATTLENFYQIDDSLYRSGQPGEAQMKELERRGVKSVLNLRNFHTDDDEAKGTSLALYHVPMEAGRFTQEQVIEALRVVYLAPKPVLVHCWHGSDRTGLTVAMYRLVFQNWSKEAAIEELQRPEFGYHRWAYYNIIQYIRKVDVDDVRRQVVGEKATVKAVQ
ncbi:dual specificity protein phosphatase family protein [Leminorella grimontii]|uniref:dual specificity protein phosphatase family protein n=1 Tax=Leminorella grimontii TaxID=82981 RepID=UPI00208832AC|nr:dual specificity protein phosphatase family protein [Leminorella grimontii]GKX59333.1 protein-tyrosine-phosphatase [Leminorella grimontii]